MQISQNELNDEQQWVNETKKDPEKFHKLYDRYFEVIFAFIYRRTDDEAIAADLTSQTFLKALQSIKKYVFKGLPFSAWLYKIARNEVNLFYRAQKRRSMFSLEEEVVVELISEEWEDPQEKVDILVRILKDLPENDLLLLELKFYEGKSFKELAYIFDLSESGAKMRTYRVLDRLKKKLKKLIYD